ncbi:MAG: TetR/AcrR family transcriptional regulator [Trebonia sp.]
MVPPADQPDAAPHRQGGGRRRGALLTSAIYRATFDELAETGFDKLSFDKIAASAGTGKAALYRRWATPTELVLEALTDPLSGFGSIPVPSTGSLRGDLIFLLGGFARNMEREPRGRALFPLITQRQRHPELYASLRRILLEPGQQRILDVLRAAADRGEVDPAAVTPRIVALGPRLVMAELMEHGTVAPAEVEAIVDEVLIPVLVRRP